MIVAHRDAQHEVQSGSRTAGVIVRSFPVHLSHHPPEMSQKHSLTAALLLSQNCGEKWPRIAPRPRVQSHVPCEPQRWVVNVLGYVRDLRLPLNQSVRRSLGAARRVNCIHHAANSRLDPLQDRTRRCSALHVPLSNHGRTITVLESIEGVERRKRPVPLI